MRAWTLRLWPLPLNTAEIPEKFCKLAASAPCPVSIPNTASRRGFIIGPAPGNEATIGKQGCCLAF